MLRLVLKDFYVFKKDLLFITAFEVISAIIVFFIKPDFYLTWCANIILWSPMPFIFYETRKNSFAFLCSLPVKRTQIVISKYIWLFIYLLTVGIILIIIALVLLQFSSDIGKTTSELKSRKTDMIVYPVVFVLILSVISTTLFKSGTSKNYIGKAFKSWLKYVIPIGAFLVVILILLFKDIDFDLIINNMEYSEVLFGIGFFIALAMSVIALFSVMAFVQRDL